jgi:Na+-transporting methylmalonyl-CoA/oxaloacetate decarboxylase gamma subunit
MSIWAEGARVALLGFSVVFITLMLLAIGVKIMSFCCMRLVDKKKKGGR